MPTRLHRLYGLGHLHSITFSCHDRKPLLDTSIARNFFVDSLDKIRIRYRFKLVGYVVMPEHVHFLMSEPEVGNPSVAIMALKYCVARDLGCQKPHSPTLSFTRRDPGPLRPIHFWKPRFYDFNVYSSAKKREKLQYMHENPVTRGLVRNPASWIWSSFRSYASGEPGIIPIDLVD
jgi:putative transposase